MENAVKYFGNGSLFERERASLENAVKCSGNGSLFERERVLGNGFLHARNLLLVLVITHAILIIVLTNSITDTET